jgi:hypothetical protein
MDEIHNMIVNIPQEESCTDEEVLQDTQRLHRCLLVFYYIFLKSKRAIRVH